MSQQAMVDVMALDELQEGRLRLARVGTAKVALCRIGATVHAVSAICTHAKVFLAPGRLCADGLIECPMHGAKFSPIDGSVRCPPAMIPLAVHAVRVEGGRVLVDPVGIQAAQPPPDDIVVRETV